MKSYQEMAEAVFREGDARLAAKRKRDKKIAAGAAVGLALAVGLTVYGIARRTPETVQPSLPQAPEAATGVITATRETTAQGNEAMAATGSAQQPDATGNDPAATDSRQPTDWQPPAAQTPQAETPTGGAQTGPREEATTATLTTEPSGEQPSGAASYNSGDWTQAAVSQSGWALFPRWPGYEDKFWVYYDGRTYRCDPYAGQPQTYGEYLCGLSDCAHDFADEEGAGVYVMLEDGAPVPVSTAIVIVFPDGGSYAMLREGTE